MSSSSSSSPSDSSSEDDEEFILKSLYELFRSLSERHIIRFIWQIYLMKLSSIYRFFVHTQWFIWQTLFKGRCRLVNNKGLLSQHFFSKYYCYNKHRSLLSISLRDIKTFKNHFKHNYKHILSFKIQLYVAAASFFQLSPFFIDSSKIFQQFWKPDDLSDDQLSHLQISVRSDLSSDKSDNLNFA